MTFSCFYWVCSRFSWRNWMTFLKICFVLTSIKNSFLFPCFQENNCPVLTKKILVFFFKSVFRSFKKGGVFLSKLNKKNGISKTSKLIFTNIALMKWVLLLWKKFLIASEYFLAFWSWLICFFLHIVNVFHGSFYQCKSELAKFFSLVDSQ